MEEHAPPRRGLSGLDLGVEYGDDGYSSPASSALSPASSARGEPGAYSDDDGGGSTRTDEAMENFTFWPYGFQLRAVYDHGKKNAEIMGVSYNGRMRQFVILDSKGITTWSKDAIEHTVQRAMSYPKYEYRLITHLVYVRKYNVYFVLSKDFAVKVLNRDFDETCRVSADLRSVLFMLFNPVTDELITGGVGGTKVWRYHQVANKTWKEIRPMANYKLTLKYELKNVGGSWVKKVELDLAQQHLYCCSDTDLQAYDMEGNSIFRFERAHAMSITGCAYSRHARHLVTASADREVKVWSITGGLVHTFRGHSQAVTDLVLHPEDTSLVITSSLDGTVRMWSLDILEPLYSLVVSTEGVRWMGLTEDNLLYLSTARNLSVWSLNTTTTFWSLARCRVTSLRLAPGHDGKSTRVMAVGEDSRANRKSVSMVMPPPPISPLTRILGVTHVRDVNVSYVLINSRYLWLYTNRSDPACRMAVWDLIDIQTRLLYAVQAKGQPNQDADTEKRPGSAVFGGRGGSHRATLEGSGNETVSECRCVCYLNSPAVVWTEEGSCCPIQRRYLLLGLDDGRILFMDPLIKEKRYLEFRANKDAICYMEHDEHHSCLVTRCDLGDACLLQFWDLPSLRLLYELYTPSDVTVFSRLDDSFLTGHESGAILHHKLIPVVDGPNNSKPKSLRQDLAAIFAASDKSGHRDAVTSLDVCYSLRIFLSASTDGLVKIWDEAKSQVSEIQLDESLTSACFLNQFGDVIAAFKNHIFFIDRSKVSEQSVQSEDMSKDDGEESDQFEDISMLTELGESAEPIDMKSYLVPYKSALAKEFSSGGKYVGVDSPTDLQEIPNVEETKFPSAPSEVYDSPRSSSHDLALIDLTLSAEVTEYDLRDKDNEGTEVLPVKEKSKKMTPKERRRALRRKNRTRTVQFDMAPKLDEQLGVELPQFGASPCSTPRSCPSSMGSGDDDACSWLSYSTGGRSTPDDLSWDSDEDYDEASEEEADGQGSPSASPRRERKPKPTPSSRREAEDGTTLKPEEPKASRKKFSDNIRVDAKQIMKEDEMRKRSERKRQRRQADQAASTGSKEDEVVAMATIIGSTPAPETPKIREIKKKEKRAVRRVGERQVAAPKLGASDAQEDQDASITAGLQASEKVEEEERLKQEKLEEEERKKQLQLEEQEKQKAEVLRKQREQEEKRRKEEEKRKQEEIHRKEEEDRKKQTTLELIERDKKERERLEELKKAKAQRDGKIESILRPESPGKLVAQKRVTSAKTKVVKRSSAHSTNRRRPKPSSTKPKGAPRVNVVPTGPASQMGKLEPAKDVQMTDNEKKETTHTSPIEVPQVELHTPPQDKINTVDTASQFDQIDVNTVKDTNIHKTMDFPDHLSTLGLGDSMHSRAFTDHLSVSLACPGSPTPTSLTEMSEFPGSLLTPPLSPSRLSMVSSRPQTSISFFSRPQTSFSEVSKKTKTVTFSPPSSPTPTGLRPSVTHQDVQSWLASASDDVQAAESAADNRSLFGDGRCDALESQSQTLSRSRSPGGCSDAGSEMTVPHVEVSLPTEKDDDWWWRKSRRRRSLTSGMTQTPVTPAEGARQRPLTAQVLITNLTTKELEKAYEEGLHHYQDSPGTPEKLHQNEGTKFDDNWHDRAIERHMLLKMQRHLRTQSANDKARRIFREQQERRRGLVEKKSTKDKPTPGDMFFIPKGGNTQPSISVTRASSSTGQVSTVPGGRGPGGPVVSPGRAHSVRSVPAGVGGRSRMSSAPSFKCRPATAAGRMQLTPAPAPAEGGRSEKADLGAELPFRCRLTPSAPSPARARSGTLLREEIDLRMLDPRNPVSGQYRSRTGASVPSKCSRYVLVEGARVGDPKVMPTVLEQKLISKRFPQHQDEWIGHAKPPPKFRPPLLLYHPPAFTQYATT